MKALLKVTAVALGLTLLVPGLGAARPVVVLRLLDTRLSEEPSRAALTEIVRQFMKQNPDIQVELESVRSADMLTRFLVSSEAGQPPDVTYLYAGMLAGTAERGYLLDLRPYVAKEGRDFMARFYDLAIEATRHKGTQYALPTIVSIYGFWVNRDMLRAAGIDKPFQTWEEFLSHAKRLTRDTNGDGRVDQWAYAMIGRTRSAIQRLAPWFSANGVDWISADGKMVLPQRAQAIEAFKFYVELATVHNVVPPGPTAIGASEIRINFANRTVAMTYDGPYAAAFHLRENPEMVPDRQVVWAFPRRKKQAEFASVNWLAISSKTKHPNEAWRLITYLTDRLASLQFSLATGFLSANVDANNSRQIMGDPLRAVFVRSLPTGSVFPEHPKFPEVADLLVIALQEALTGKKSPEQALRDFFEQADRMLR